MAEFSFFVGIDVSKKWIDIAIVSSIKREANAVRVINESTAIFEYIVGLQVDLQETLFCMEHTGKYCNPFLSVAGSLDLHAWLENPLAIKRSLGLTRGKSDKLDAKRIADYAYRYKDKACLWKEEDPIVVALSELQAKRSLLIKVQTQLKLSAERKNDAYLGLPLEALHKAIIENEKSAIRLIKSDSRILRQHQLLTSVPGVGPILSVAMIVVTKGFSRLTDPRKLACYGGIAPFPYSTGTSLLYKDRVSKIGNQKLKSLLHIAAWQAIRHMPSLKKYYERKVAEGKNKTSINNAVRNKLLGIMLSVIRRDTPFTENYSGDFAEEA